MADINTSVGPGGQPLPEKVMVSKTEPVKADKEAPEEIAKKNPQGLLMASFCAYVQKIVTFLTNAATRKRGVLSGSGLEHHLDEFKKSLVILSKEDRSRDQAFVINLSGEWHALLENFNLFEFLERKKSPHIAKVKNLIEAIQSFPPQQEHSLGYYMTAFAGKDWLPFPFMELLQKLHEDHLKNKEKSQLFLWIASIDKLLLDLTRK
ncbi:MAG TPA: hypothetical protein PKW79_02795 [Rhabdochlamydiaceae bacterium]|nr:hypothetical protein [Rhabdochlamydiaceae bacterium]